MRTVFYADVYFILNFIVNLFLISMTAVFRQKKNRFLKWSFLSALFAGGSVLLYMALCRKMWLLTVSAPVQMFFFVYVCFPFCGWQESIKDFFTFLFLACFSGGVITAVFSVCRRFFRGYFILWFFCAFLFLFCLIYWLRFELIAGVRRKESVFTVKIFFEEKQVEACALYDTGNTLVSPYTGEGVTVISGDLAKLLGLEEKRCQLIPYHSIGGGGMMKAFRVDAIEIIGKGEKKEHVLVAVSDTIQRTAKIKVILNCISFSRKK